MSSVIPWADRPDCGFCRKVRQGLMSVANGAFGKSAEGAFVQSTEGSARAAAAGIAGCVAGVSRWQDDFNMVAQCAGWAGGVAPSASWIEVERYDLDNVLDVGPGTVFTSTAGEVVTVGAFLCNTLADNTDVYDCSFAGPVPGTTLPFMFHRKSVTLAARDFFFFLNLAPGPPYLFVSGDTSSRYVSNGACDLERTFEVTNIVHDPGVSYTATIEIVPQASGSVFDYNRNAVWDFLTSQRTVIIDRNGSTWNNYQAQFGINFNFVPAIVEALSNNLATYFVQVTGADAQFPLGLILGEQVSVQSNAYEASLDGDFIIDGAYGATCAFGGQNFTTVTPQAPLPALATQDGSYWYQRGTNYADGMWGAPICVDGVTGESFSSASVNGNQYASILPDGRARMYQTPNVVSPDKAWRDSTANIWVYAPRGK